MNSISNKPSTAPIQYVSTRSAAPAVSFSEALLRGLAPDGGLYVPTRLPALDLGAAHWGPFSYSERCFHILAPFMPELPTADLRMAIERAYGQGFESAEVAPVVAIDETTYALELFGGRTQAFKDMALSLLPHLMQLAAAATASRLSRRLVLTATSGDTGKAALEAFADLEGMDVIVFYPTVGVSEMQRLQMATQQGSNVHVFAIEGNFDDAQRAVKALMSDHDLMATLAEQGVGFAAANSVNIGRLLPQIVYYVSGYHDLVAKGSIDLGEAINVVVPTGNFGNILAAYYAKAMGLPIGQLILAANDNDVLHDFVTSGSYQARRPFHITPSPSMDILVSSNLERLLYRESNGNYQAVSAAMKQLATQEAFEWQLPSGLLQSGSANRAETLATIGDTYRSTGYLLDPHTAVAMHVLKGYRQRTGDTRKALVAATASPFKFPQTVLEALQPVGQAAATESQATEPQATEPQATELLAQLNQVAALWGRPVPAPLLEALSLPIKHSGVIAKADIAATVRAVIGGFFS